MSTKKHKTYWSTRKIDWKKEYLETVNHPHRQMIVNALQRIAPFQHLFEMGCASGPNLLRVAREFPGTQVGGIDISADAIATARQYLPKGAVLDVGSVENTFFADKCTDVVLADAVFIYCDRTTIGKALEEVRRIARKHLVLVEFHEPSWWKRCAIWWKSGYYAYDYKKLLESYGFWDVQMTKIPNEVWGFPWGTFGYVITAKI